MKKITTEKKQETETEGMKLKIVKETEKETGSDKEAGKAPEIEKNPEAGKDTTMKKTKGTKGEKIQEKTLNYWEGLKFAHTMQ